VLTIKERQSSVVFIKEDYSHRPVPS